MVGIQRPFGRNVRSGASRGQNRLFWTTKSESLVFYPKMSLHSEVFGPKMVWRLQIVRFEKISKKIPKFFEKFDFSAFFEPRKMGFRESNFSRNFSKNFRKINFSKFFKKFRKIFNHFSARKWAKNGSGPGPDLAMGSNSGSWAGPKISRKIFRNKFFEKFNFSKKFRNFFPKISDLAESFWPFSLSQRGIALKEGSKRRPNRSRLFWFSLAFLGFLQRRRRALRGRVLGSFLVRAWLSQRCGQFFKADFSQKVKFTFAPFLEHESAKKWFFAKLQNRNFALLVAPGMRILDQKSKSSLFWFLAQNSHTWSP